ncbi:MAG: choice-of-anchor A family protein [Opitutaceae bacterium]
MNKLTFITLGSFIVANIGHSMILDLGEAQGYNAVIFGNHVALNADTEGRLAVGGNASLPSSYSVGQSVIGPQNAQSSGARNDLVVGGNLTLPSGIVTVNYGNVQVGGSISGAGALSQGSGNQAFSGVSNFESTIFNFSAVESLVRSYSSAWESLGPAGTVNDLGYELKLTGTSNTLNVFHVTADEWNLFGARIFDVPVGSTVIVNISGTNVSNGGGDIRFGTNATDLLPASDYRNNIIFNLHEALAVQSDFFSWEGTVIAPDATLTTNGGAINGQAFFEDVNQEGGFEFHSFSVEAENAPVPEASSYALIAGAFALGVSLSRRRRTTAIA